MHGPACLDAIVMTINQLDRLPDILDVLYCNDISGMFGIRTIFALYATCSFFNRALETLVQRQRVRVSPVESVFATQNSL